MDESINQRDDRDVRIAMMVESIFSKFDADQNGSIDKQEARPLFIAEIKKAGETQINISDEVLNEYFNKADLNQDGKITKEEAAIFIGKYMIK